MLVQRYSKLKLVSDLKFDIECFYFVRAYKAASLNQNSKAALVVACCWMGGRICSWSLQQGPPKMKDCAIFEIRFNISNPTPSRANFGVAFNTNGTL